MGKPKHSATLKKEKLPVRRLLWWSVAALFVFLTVLTLVLWQLGLLRSIVTFFF